MSLTEKITIYIMLSVTLFLIVYDIVIAIEPTPGDTISKVCLSHFYRFPFTAWSFGVVIAHLSWPYQYEWPYHLWASIPVLILFAALMFAGSWFNILPRVVPMVYILAGVPFGHLLWPQR